MEIYDISLTLAPGMHVFPGDPPFRRDVVISPAEGKPCTVSALQMGSHTGTHIDAPAHFIPGGATVEQLRPEQLCGMCRVIHLPGNESVRAMDVERMGLEACECILFKTDNSLRLGTTGYFRKAVTIEPAAAAILAGLGPKLVGIDFLSVDAPGSDDFGSHLALLEAGVVILEGLDLRPVNPGDYELYCAPLKIKGGDGAPARVFLRR